MGYIGSSQWGYSQEFKLTKYLTNGWVLNIVYSCLLDNGASCRSWAPGLVLTPLKRKWTNILRTVEILAPNHIDILVLYVIWHQMVYRSWVPRVVLTLLSSNRKCLNILNTFEVFPKLYIFLFLSSCKFSYFIIYIINDPLRNIMNFQKLK